MVRNPLQAVALLAALSVSTAETAAAPRDWRNAERITPAELASLLRSPAAGRPAMFHVGFRVLFVQSHIPGSRYAGPGRDEQGLELLRKATASLAKDKLVVLYCGCCPWEKCPNMEPAWKALVAAGFTHVKVLYIPRNFGADWVQPGYPVESGDAGPG